jgi:hypothetical protein
MSIIKGVVSLIDEQLRLDAGAAPHYEKLESCQQLSDTEVEGFDGAGFVESIYERLDKNWKRGKGSAENWRWEPRPTLTKGKDNKGHRGAEVPFERTIAILSEMRHFGLENVWTNQMPVASKLTDELEGRRAIDLVHNCLNGTYDFIELKLPGDKNRETPLAAAMEVLIYGLLYVFSRINIKELDYDPVKKKVLSEETKHINLLVVAPQKFYVDERRSDEQKYKLGWFQRELDSGLAEFLRNRHPNLGLSMNFRFEAIDDHFLKPYSDHGFSLTFKPAPVYCT